MKYACFALAVGLLGLAAPAVGQEVIYSAPAVTYAPGAPVATYYAPGVPVATYYAPPPVATYYAPAVVPAYTYYPSTYVVPRRVYRRAVRWGW